MARSCLGAGRFRGTGSISGIGDVGGVGVSAGGRIVERSGPLEEPDQVAGMPLAAVGPVGTAMEMGYSTMRPRLK